MTASCRSRNYSHKSSLSKLKAIKKKNIKKSPMVVPMSKIIPHVDDMKQGKGKGYYNWPGTKRARLIVNRRKREYQSASKAIKRQIILETKEAIKTPSLDGDGHSPRIIRCVHGQWMEIPEDEVYDKVRHLLRDKKLYMDFSSSETESISSDNSTASATLPTVVTDDDSSEVDTFVNMMDDSMASPICVQEVYDRFVNSGDEVTEALQQFDTIQVSFDEEGSYLDNESFPW